MKSIKKPEPLGNILSINNNDDLLLMENFKKIIINSYYINKFNNDDKVLHNFIKHIETKVRKSDQYNDYLGFLRYEFGLNSCSILGNIDDDLATIEFHHYPFTLYDIVEIVLRYHIEKSLNTNSFLLTNFILDLHCENKVGLIPLTKTVHEIIHNKDSDVLLPKESIFGNVNSFVETYRKYIPLDTLERYNKRILNEKDDKEKIFKI